MNSASRATVKVALGAIATDSIGNRLLWAGSAAGDVDRAMGLAGPLVAATDLGMPKPRFVRVGSTPAVRRASCCPDGPAPTG